MCTHLQEFEIQKIFSFGLLEESVEKVLHHGRLIGIKILVIVRSKFWAIDSLASQWPLLVQLLSRATAECFRFSSVVTGEDFVFEFLRNSLKTGYSIAVKLMQRNECVRR